MIEAELITDNQYLLWMMDRWTDAELSRAIERHHQRRGFRPHVLRYNKNDLDKLLKLNTLGIHTREDGKVPQGYINLA